MAATADVVEPDATEAADVATTDVTAPANSVATADATAPANSTATADAAEAAGAAVPADATEVADTEVAADAVEAADAEVAADTATTADAAAPADSILALPVFDLRNADLDGSGARDYTTSVKNQNQTAVCWIFAPIAAAEISALAGGAEDVDFSELFVALVMNRAGTEEGLVVWDGRANPFQDIGDNGEYIASRMISWRALMDESVLDEEYPTYTLSRNEFEWLTDESAEGFSIKIQDVDFLPSPADRRGRLWTGYNEAGTAAIREALAGGNGVTICYRSSPGLAGSSSTSDLNYATKALYADDPRVLYASDIDSTAHMVTIVGWDDTYSADNFLVRPEGDGAWIVKNSWGTYESRKTSLLQSLQSATTRRKVLAAYREAYGDAAAAAASDEELARFALSVDEDGYFYISYYDKSLYQPMVFHAEENDYNTIHQYDFLNMLSPSTQAESPSGGKVANVFTALTDQVVKAVSTYTAEADSTVKMRIYKLGEGASGPEDGVLLAEEEAVIPYKGYHTLRLTEPLEILAAERFSVVAEILNALGQAYTPIELGYDEDGYDYRVSANKPGQSYLYLNGKWQDLSEGYVYTTAGWMTQAAFDAAKDSTLRILYTAGSPMIKAYANDPDWVEPKTPVRPEEPDREAEPKDDPELIETPMPADSDDPMNPAAQDPPDISRDPRPGKTSPATLDSPSAHAASGNAVPETGDSGGLIRDVLFLTGSLIALLRIIRKRIAA